MTGYRDYLEANLPLMRAQAQSPAPVVPPGNDPRVARAIIAAAIANTQRKPVPAPLTPAQYAGGGGGVVANDILGQRGPVVIAPGVSLPVDRRRLPIQGPPTPTQPASVAQEPIDSTYTGPVLGPMSGTYNGEPLPTTGVMNSPVDPANPTGLSIGESANVLTEAAITGAVKGATGLPVVGPYIEKGLQQVQRPFNWNIKNVGDSVYAKANGATGPQTVGGVNWNPTYYIVEPWATDPENKDLINTVYTKGLDLNGDGQVDVQGGQAVMMAYFADQSPGFLDQMMTQAGFDPLFYAAQVGPAASAVKEGAAVGAEQAGILGGARRAAEGTTALTKTEMVLNAVERAMAGVERAGEIGNKIQDAPITLPIEIARRLGRGSESLSTLWREITGPGADAVEQTAREQATSASGQALKATDLPPVAEDLPLSEDVPSAATVTRTEPQTTPRTPEEFAAETERFATDPYLDAAESGETPLVDETVTGKADATNDAPVSTVLDKPIEQMTREERNAALKAGVISVTDPIPGGTRLIDKAAELPEYPAFVEKYAPLAEAWQAEDQAITAQLKTVDERLDQIRKVEIPAAKTAQQAATGRDYLPDTHPLIVEQAPLFEQKRALENERVLLGIEHVVDSAAPVYKETFGDLPPIAPSAEPAAQVQVTTKQGVPTFHRDGTPVMVDAAYKDQPLPYLYQRYVYEDSAKKAANTIEALRKRPDLMNQPYAEETLQRLQDSRKILTDLKAERDITQMGAPVKEPEAPLSPSAADTLQRDAAFSIDDQVARGELSAEAGSYLKQPVRSYRMKMTKKGPSKNGRWQNVPKADAEAWAVANKVDVTPPNFKHAMLEATDTTPMDVLQRIVGENRGLSSAEIQEMFAHEMTVLTGTKVPPRVDLHPTISKIMKPGKLYVKSLRSSALHNVVTGWKGIIQDRISDPLRMAMEGYLSAAVQSLSPAHWGRKALGRESNLLRKTEFYGMDPIKVSSNIHRTEVALAERTPTHELVSGALLRKEGSLGDRAVGVATGVLDNRTIARARAGLDDVSREAMAETVIDMGEAKMVREFTERARLLAETNDILPASVNAYLSEMENMTPATMRETMAELARDAGLKDSAATHFGNKLAEDWRHRVGELRNKANAEQKRVLFSFERTKFDEKLGGVIFYHYWMTRAIPAYARIALRNPEIAAMWQRAWQDMERRAEREGFPDSVKGLVRFMGSRDGFYGLWDPWNVILPVADMLPDVSDDAPMFDKVFQFVALSPPIQMAATVIGLSNRIPEMAPGGYAVKKMSLAIVNEIRANSGKPPILADGWTKLEHDAFQLANDIIGEVPIPGFAQRAFLDPAVISQSEIRSVVATKVAEQTGVPVEQWQEGDANYELWVQTISDGEAGISNPLYQEAFQEWSEAKLKGTVLNSVIPGGVRTRYGPRDELLVGDLTDQQTDFKRIMNAGGAEDAKLDLLKAQYADLGTPDQRLLAGGYNQIMDPSDLPDGSTTTIYGKTYSKTQILALDEDQRRELAKAWVAQYDGTDELKAYRDERDAWVADHPEFASYAGDSGWQDIAYNYEGGLHQFRVDREKGNPNFKKASAAQRDYLLNVKKIDPKLVEEELDQWAVGIEAYKAAQGIKNYIYDADPISTGDQATVDSIVRSIGSGSGSGGSSTKKTNAQKLQDDITKYDTDMAIVSDLMTSYGWDPALLESNNPYIVDTLDRTLGDLIPNETTLMKQYHLWQQAQPEGYDTSVTAFGQYLDDLKEKQAA